MDELTQGAWELVQEMLPQIRETALNQDEINESVIQLAQDHVMANGGAASQANIIARFLLTRI